MAAISVDFENVGVRIGGRVILEDISASVPAGGATVILGPNGAGKTTLLRCLLGETRYSGKIVFRLADGHSAEHPVIGYVPQLLQADAGLPLRVYEFLTLGISSRPLWLGCSAGARARARDLLKLVDAEKLERQRLGSLSGGETRRVLLAAALGRNPELLLLDEPEAGVDYSGERLFWELLDRSRKKFGFTILMVSHNLHLAAHYATNVICIKKRLLAEGAPAKTLDGKVLMDLFGLPIHLYPSQCVAKWPVCAECGAFGSESPDEKAAKREAI